MLNDVRAERHGRPLVLIDIAVPRDIEAACGDIPGVTLYDIDDLQAVVARNLEVREGERSAAEAIVEDEIHRFARWMGQLDVQPTISALRRLGDDVVQQVLGENAGRWETMSASDRARVEAVARSVMQRLLHEPTIRLKAADHDTGHGKLQLARELFGLDEPATAERQEPAEVRELRRRSADAHRDPGQRAGPRPGRAGGRASRRRAGDDHDVRRRRRSRGRQGPLGRRDRGRAARRRHRPRDPLRQGRPRRARRGAGDRRGDRARGPARRARRRELARGPARRRARRDVLPAPPRRSCWRCAPTSRSSSCGATSTRACASSTRARPTRWSSPPPGCCASAAPSASAPTSTPRSSSRPPGRARSPSRGAPAPSTWPPRCTTPPRAPRWRPSAASAGRWTRRATRRSAPAFDGAELHAFVGLPDGSTWIRDQAPPDEALARLEAVGARELLARAEEAAA